MHEKHAQVERDFGISSPLTRLRASLRREGDREVSPFSRSVCYDRLGELHGKGIKGHDGAIVMLMRSANREVVAAGMGYQVNPPLQVGRADWASEIPFFVAAVREQVKVADLDSLAAEAVTVLSLWRGLRRG